MYNTTKEVRMTRVLKYLLLHVAALPSLALASDLPAVRFAHHDWELACDNTRTCRVAGYHEDGAELAVSVLLTRKAGPHAVVTGQVMLGEYGELPALERLPDVFELALSIDGQPVGTVAMSRTSMLAELTQAQVSALLASLVRTSRIEFTHGEDVWHLSDRGASAVLLKMDEFQGRIGTPGALTRKGQKDEGSVRPALPAPMVKAAPLPAPLPGDAHFTEAHASTLLAALRALDLGDDCPDVSEPGGEVPELQAVRLTGSRMLLSARCWGGAYNIGYGFWVVNATPPHQPVLVTTQGSEQADGALFASHKGRGLGDCWTSEAWTWDGSRFVPTSVTSTGMCRLMAPGGAWSLPTLVTEVHGAAQR